MSCVLRRIVVGSHLGRYQPRANLSGRLSSGLDGLVGDALRQPTTAAVPGGRTGSQNRQSDHEQMRDGAEGGRAEKVPNTAPNMKAFMLVMVDPILRRTTQPSSHLGSGRR
jgi:hypothetical protein